MKFKDENYILNIIKYAPLFFVIVVVFILLSLLFIEKNTTFENEKNAIASQYEKENKRLIKERVENIYQYVIREQKNTENELKKSLNVALDNAYNIMNSIYEKNKDKSYEEIKKLIKDALVDIRFNDGRGYFFIYDKSANNIMHPILPHYEGKNFLNYQDANHQYIFKDMIQLLSQKDTVYYEWYWQKPSDLSKEIKKIGLLKNFKPFNWFIGTGEYVEDFEKQVQEKVLNHIQNMRYGKSGYIFVIDYDTIYLSHLRKSYIGKSAVANQDTQYIQKVITDLIEIAKNGDGYYSYVQNKKPGIDEPVTKVSYVKGLNNWSWMIGTGFYEDDLNALIKNKRETFDEKFESYVINAIISACLLIFALLLISFYLSRTLSARFKNYKHNIKVKALENAEQKNMITQQSKMAAMGEMIGNIAHQWRQPLSTITTTSTGIQLQKELNMLDDKLLDEGLENINQAANHLSSTIDDFRNFFDVNKKTTDFQISHAITKTLKLISVQFHNNDILIIKEIEDSTLRGHENELIQVFINILNNARDELLKLPKEQKRLIIINVENDDNSCYIHIQDNAGGIPEDIVEKVFNPYFTTKKDKDGTGIGLHMSKEIVEDNLKGKLSVENQTFNYEDVEYTGATFTITIPFTK